ncbi:MAG TPA: hypothetical protein VMA73_29185 [Streptosporangiaceae bacterium]|nr:hypothetical protein [Streptosporangiaceae bacterium]
MRFFQRAQRPGGGRLIAAVAGAVAAAAVVLAGDARSLVWPAVLDAGTLLGPGPGPVASGKVENASWQIFIRPSTQLGHQPGSMCIYAALGDFVPGTCGAFPPAHWGPTHPAWFYDSALESPQLQVRYALGWVDADVTSVVVRLRDGQQLKLNPVTRYGQRLVAFVIPMRAGIVGATAYLNNGRYATTIPSSSPDALTFVNSWVWHSPDAPATT